MPSPKIALAFDLFRSGNIIDAQGTKALQIVVDGIAGEKPAEGA